jgi:hypothetical protein
VRAAIITRSRSFERAVGLEHAEQGVVVSGGGRVAYVVPEQGLAHLGDEGVGEALVAPRRGRR